MQRLPDSRWPRLSATLVKEDLVVRMVIIPNHAPATNQINVGRRLPPAHVCSLPRGDKNEFRLDAGDQTKVPVTMQKWHAPKNSVRCYQAVIR
jgi:hypothetical protein